MNAKKIRFPPLSTVFFFSFAIFAQAQNFSSYVPACVPPCVEQTLRDTKICAGLDDARCFCTNFLPIFPSSRTCFAQTCGINEGELRSQVISGLGKFCNDSGTSLDFGGFPGGFPGGPPWSPTTPPSSPTSSTTTPPPQSTSTTPPPTSSPSTLPAPASESDSIPAPPSGLSTGVKAGIGAGAGVGGLAVISGLLFMGYRLGRRRKQRSSDRENALERGDPPGQQGSNKAGDGEEGGQWGYNKPQLEGTTIAELPSHLPPHHVIVGELPVLEGPVEMLGHGVSPTELSADAEVSRDRTRGSARL